MNWLDTFRFQHEVPGCLFLSNDIVLVDNTKVGVKAKLDILKELLESKGFKISSKSRGTEWEVLITKN